MSHLTTALLTGFSIGIFGSFHCIGMCGPLALALPVQGFNVLKKNMAIVLYNLGRAFSYSILGFLFGLLGSRFSIWGLQQTMSIVAGIVLLILVFTNYSRHINIAFIQQANNYIKKELGSLLQKPQTIGSFFSIGVLNGLLPCGLVYVAIAVAIATSNIAESIAVMFAFGLGTFPFMISFMLLGNIVSINIRHKMKQLTPVFISTMAVILILRGMNLNIPFISPQMQATSTSQVISCH